MLEDRIQLGVCSARCCHRSVLLPLVLGLLLQGSSHIGNIVGSSRCRSIHLLLDLLWLLNALTLLLSHTVSYQSSQLILE